MKIDRIALAIEKIAPIKLAQDWDNVGFLIGDPAKNIKNILITIDTTNEVVAEAKKLSTDLIMSYHPIIWDGLKKITATGPTAPVYELIRSGISVYSIHTSLDVAAGGVNDSLAAILGITNPKPIGDYVENPQGPYYKLTTFIPTKNVNPLAKAVYKAGAGRIGTYAKCSFQTKGTGTFLPLEGSKPTIGKQGKLEKVEEIRFETIVAADNVPNVIAAMRNTHPYETPAFDIMRHYDLETRFGLGRIGKLEKPTPLPQIIRKIKEITGAKAVGIIGKEKRTVKTAAVCAGSCGKILDTVIAQKCDLYLTGELKHHHALAAQQAGVTCICLSHTVSERFALKNLAKMLKNELKGVTIRQSRKDTDPFVWKNI